MEHQWKMSPLKSLRSKWAASSSWHWGTQWKPVWGKCPESVSWGYTRWAYEFECVEHRCALRLPPSAANLEGESGVETGGWETDFRCFLHCDGSSLHGMKCQGTLLPPATPLAGGGKKQGSYTSAGADGCVLVSLEEKNRRRSRCHLGLVERTVVCWWAGHFNILSFILLICNNLPYRTV